MKNWYVEFGGILGNSFTRNMFIRIDENEKTKTQNIKERFKNSDFYRTNYIYDNIEDINSATIYGPMVIDLDIDLNTDEDLENLKIDLLLVLSTLDLLMGITEDNIAIYFSGNKGFHIIIPPSIFGLVPHKNLNLVYKRIAEELYDITTFKTVDLKIYDKRRLIRVVNSINEKTGLYKVPISSKKLNTMGLEQLKAYASSPKETREIIDTKKKTKAIAYIKSLIEEDKRRAQNKRNKNNINYKKVFKKKKMPKVPCIKNIVENGASIGQRNDTTVALSSIIFQSGYDFEETMQMVKYWNESKNEEPLKDSEIETTVKSAYSMFLEGRKFGCSTLSELSECSENCPMRSN